MNVERPVSNRLAHELDVQRMQRMHQQRLREISVDGKRRSNLGNEWTRSKPTYRHITENRKRAQLEADRYDTIERENRMLLEKIALMEGGSTLDPTEGTQEFQPGVRLTRTQRPVIDHAISHQPQMPQRGAAREPISLNWSARRRELERINQENRGIVTRIQGRESNLGPRSQWRQRSEEHDRHLMMLRRPATSHGISLPRPPSPMDGRATGNSSVRTRRPLYVSSPVRPASRRDRKLPQLSSLLSPTQSGDAHILVGLASGLVSGAMLTLRPQEVDEETVVIHETWLRRDGLVVLLKDPVKRAHPAGSHVMLLPAAL